MPKTLSSVFRKFWKQPRHTLTRTLTDQKVVGDALWDKYWSNGQVVDPPIFEHAAHLDSLPIAPLAESKILKMLDFNTVNRRPRGGTLSDQIESLLKEISPLYGLCQKEKCALTYTISRLIYEPLPRGTSWMWYPEGGGPFSLALFVIERALSLSSKKVPWLNVLLDPSRFSQPLCEAPLVTTRPDGPVATVWSELFSRLRFMTNSMAYEPLRELCKKISKVSEPRGVHWSDVAAVTGAARRSSYEILGEIDLLLTERFLPNLGMFGLRYRFVLNQTERRRRERHDHRGDSVVTSQGLIEHTLFGKNPDTQFISMYGVVERIDSKGPRDVPEDWFQIVADRELISVRLDLFDPSSGTWKPTLQSIRKKRSSSWLYRESPVSRQNKVGLNKSRAEMLGALWAHRGSPLSRARLLSMLGFSRITRIEAFSKLTESSLFNVLYYPAIEYASLPELIVVAGKADSKATAENSLQWLMSSFPYVHIHSSSSGGEFVARIRVPKAGGTVYPHGIQKRLDDFGVMHSIGVAKQVRTYYLTLPSRMYNLSTKTWFNPWDQPQ